MYKFLFFLLLIPFVFATGYGHIYEDSSELTQGELINQYCGKISFIGSILVFIGMLMWVAEPKIKKELKGKQVGIFDYQIICFMYKWLGLGILFMGAWATLRMVIA